MSLQRLMRVVNKGFFKPFESSKTLATHQTYARNEEKETHFGFETIKESDKEQKGKYSSYFFEYI